MFSFWVPKKAYVVQIDKNLSAIKSLDRTACAWRDIILVREVLTFISILKSSVHWLKCLLSTFTPHLLGYKTLLVLSKQKGLDFFRNIFSEQVLLFVYLCGYLSLLNCETPIRLLPAFDKAIKDCSSSSLPFALCIVRIYLSCVREYLFLKLQESAQMHICT